MVPWKTSHCGNRDAGVKDVLCWCEVGNISTSHWKAERQREASQTPVKIHWSPCSRKGWSLRDEGWGFCLFVLILTDFIFQSILRFTEKLHREFPCLPTPLHRFLYIILSSRMSVVHLLQWWSNMGTLVFTWVHSLHIVHSLCCNIQWVLTMQNVM